MWLIVLIKFLVPVGPGWSFSLASGVDRLAVLWPEGNGAYSEGVAIPGDEASVLWVPESKPVQATPAESAGTVAWPWGVALAMAYVVGVVLAGGVRLWRHRRLAARCRRLPRLAGPTDLLVRRICQSAGVTRVPQVRVSEQPAGPFVIASHSSKETN